MNLNLRRLLVVAAVTGYAGLLQAQPSVHPFEQPPSLPEAAPPAANVALMAFSGPKTQPCNPKGSISRTGSIVNAELNVVLGDFKINNPGNADNHDDPVRLRSYGGCKSGPVIEVLPGNTLRLNLINGLDRADPTCGSNPQPSLQLPPGVGCFNTVNLHTHGWHVSPAGNSDNVLLNIAPQTQFPYEYNIPADHPAGTFWYHAHRHGSTAVQVASGEAGVLVVRGNRPYTAPTPRNPHPVADIDTILHAANGRQYPEKIMLFQQIGYACFQNQPNQSGGPWQYIYTTNGLLYSQDSQGNPVNGNMPWTCPAPSEGKPVTPGMVENFDLQLFSPTIWDTNGRFTSINGIVEPTITLPAGEIERWRFVHAGIHDTINIQIVKAVPVNGKNVIGLSALTGNRQEQKAALLAACTASAQTLVPQFEIATDGLTRVRMRGIKGTSVSGSDGSNFMQPGYRSDVLVAFPAEGDYCLLDQAAPAQERAGNGSGPGGQGPNNPQLLAYVHVRGGKPVAGDVQTYIEKTLYDANPQLPAPVRSGLLKADLTPWAPFVELPAPPPQQPQTAIFAITNKGQFQVNNASYDPTVVNITRQVNTTDDWVLSIADTPAAEPHIFHIHVNPFEVMDVTTAGSDGKPTSIFDKDGNCRTDLPSDKQGLFNQYCGMYHTFRDTIFVENGYQVHTRTHYETYIGEFVLHCHILDHEDAGMMLNISIVPDLTAPGGGIGMGAMSHGH